MYGIRIHDQVQSVNRAGYINHKSQRICSEHSHRLAGRCNLQMSVIDIHSQDSAGSCSIT